VVIFRKDKAKHLPLIEEIKEHIFRGKKNLILTDKEAIEAFELNTREKKKVFNSFYFQDLKTSRTRKKRSLGNRKTY